LVGRGPGVKIQISPIGTAETELKSEFASQGINQTIHRIYLEVKVKVNILTPFYDIEKEITNQVLLVENVIVGRIPQNYYNLEGLDGTSDALEIIE
jgi:sporulation protein YunB